MKKTLALLLALLTLLPLAVGCMKEEESEETMPSAATTAAATETEDPYDDKVPDADYEEREFIIAAPEPWGNTYFDREEETADQVNDAIYNRNRQIETRFNITISSMNLGYTDGQASAFTPYAMSGKDVIDLIGVGFYQSAKPLITSGYALPWNDVEYINLDKAWWNKSVTETLSVLGNYYFLSGDINWTAMSHVMAMYFNKVVAEENKTIVGDLYETVINGDWTEETLYNLCKQISTENGDGVWDENDTYGICQYNCTLLSYMYNTPYETVTIDESGAHLNINTEKLTNMIEFAYSLLCENNLAYKSNDEDALTAIFFDNRALFYNHTLEIAETFRSYDSDFGILPLPKYDKEQKDYTTYSDQWGLVMALPCTASDTSRTGAITEALSCLSRQLIVPAYYDKTLIGKVKRDTESEAMLDILLANIFYDTGATFCSNTNYIPVNGLIANNKKNLTSWYKSYQKKLQSNYDELYEYVYEQKYGTAEA